MKQPVNNSGHRVDHLAKLALNGLARKYANPEAKFALLFLEDEIDECLNRELGPGTAAHNVGQRIMRALFEGGRK